MDAGLPTGRHKRPTGDEELNEARGHCYRGGACSECTLESVGEGKLVVGLASSHWRAMLVALFKWRRRQMGAVHDKVCQLHQVPVSKIKHFNTAEPVSNTWTM